LVGRRHPGVKLIALVMVAIISAASLTTGTFRIAAKTVIEGELHRAAVAPFEGYILQSFARAGDIVRAGQVLCQLDDRDFRLEHARLSAERNQLSHKHRNALTGRDVSAAQVVSAQISQVDAQLALVEERIARAKLVAPFDGIIVSGDLSQLIGAPVEQGKVLFQVAPLDSYRVILQVDEGDIAELAEGQTGELTLTGLPRELMAFTVQQITPVARAQEGRNFFQVEADLKTPSERLRPGMEGVGKVVVGERKVIWIWTRKMVNWIRLAAWKWQP
jgi:RND family efflux transporter MFP subunit